MEHKPFLWINVAVVLALSVALLMALAAVSDIVVLVVVAALLAYVFDPVVNLLEARPMSRLLATVIVFAAVSAILAVLAAFMLPLAAEQLVAIQQGFDVDQARAALDHLEVVLERRLAFLGVGDLDLLGSFQAFASAQVGDAVSYVPSVLSLAMNLAVVPFIMFFLLKDGRRIKKGLIDLVPNRYFEFTLTVLHKTDVQLGNYLRGQLTASLVVALLSILALWLLDVEYFILIGVFAGLTNMIPYLGPIVGAGVAALVSVLTTGSLDTVLPIVVSFTIIQMIDNVGVQPLVLARTVALHPLTILLALLVAGKFFGAVGLLLAVPATAVVKVFVQETMSNLRNYYLA